MKSDLKPARETKVKRHDNPAENQEIFALCLKTDDAKLLIPFKVYRVKLRGEYVCVIDELGESAVYPNNFFVTLQLPPEAITALSTANAQIS
jgi:hypothetical protein